MDDLTLSNSYYGTIYVPLRQPQNQTADYTAWIAFGIMAVCLGLSFVFVKLSLEAFTLKQAAGGRLVLGAAFLLPITYLFGDGLPLKLEFWKWAFILGML